jgi:hypothetical protein
MLLYDQVRQDLEDKIRRLEEDRHNIDISTGFVISLDNLSCLTFIIFQNSHPSSYSQAISVASGE